MASNLIWYAGRCLKRYEHGKPALLEAAVQQVGGLWQPIENRKALFKNMESLEWRSNEARNVRPSEWVAFKLATAAGERTKPWQVGQHRRLYWYVDLSAEGGQEQVHRRLTAEGVKMPHPTGTWIVRCANDEVLLLDLKQQDGTAHLASSLSKVPAYRFDPACMTKMQTGDGDIELYDLNSSAVKVIYDWTSDDAFALRIARAAASAGDVQAHDLVSWLEGFAKGRTLISVDPSDVGAANDAIRAGKMAKRLADDQELLRKFIDAFTLDERIGGVIRTYAAQTAEQERKAARNKAEKAVAQEMAALRELKLSQIDSELRDITQAQLAQLEDSRARRLKELKDEFDHRQAADEDALRRGAGVRLSAVEAAVQDLESRRAAISEQLAQLEEENEEARRSLEPLLGAASEANSALEAIRREAVEVHEALLAERATLTALQMKYPAPRLSAAATTVSPAMFGEKVAASKLLSEEGKGLMVQFAALMLGGEVPVLCGPGVRDFLAVAEMMLSAGRSIRMEADPTMITFEDLWVRPGLGASTALGYALRSAAGASGEPRTSLAVIERAERSGARFWHPALSNCAEQGDLPRRMLLCATVEDASCEEALALFAHAVCLEVNGALASNAGLRLAMEKADTATQRDELDPGMDRADATRAAAELIDHVKKLGPARSARAMRVLAQARDMDRGAPAAPFIKLFITSGGAAANPLRSVSDA